MQCCIQYNVISKGTLYKDLVCVCVCRMEAPRYQRVSPVNGDPQRLIITEEVSFIGSLAHTQHPIMHCSILTLTRSAPIIRSKCSWLLIVLVFPRADGEREASRRGCRAAEHHVHAGAL